MSVNYDRFDPTSLAGLELAARRLVMIEWLVRINPKRPCFMELINMIEHALEEGAGIATRELTAHMASLAANDVRILKQGRLLREELDNKRKDLPQQTGGIMFGRKGKKGQEGRAVEERATNGPPMLQNTRPIRSTPLKTEYLAWNTPPQPQHKRTKSGAHPCSLSGGTYCSPSLWSHSMTNNMQGSPFVLDS